MTKSSEPVLTPGMLVIMKNGNHHFLARVLRVYLKPESSGSAWNKDFKEFDTNYAEILPLVNITDLAVPTPYAGGTYTHHHPFRDLKLYDDQERRKLHDDIYTSLDLLERKIRIYQITTECDPNFSVQKWTIRAEMDRIKDESNKRLNNAEILNSIYGDCYANAHTKCKVQG